MLPVHFLHWCFAVLFKPALVLSAVWAVALWRRLRAVSAAGQGAYVYELVPKGARPDNLATVRMNATAVANVLDDAGRRAGFTILRWADEGRTHCGIAVHGLDEADASTLASRLGFAVGCAASAIDIALPVFSHVVHAARANLQPLNPNPSEIANYADQVTALLAQTAAAGRRAVIAVGIEPTTNAQQARLAAYLQYIDQSRGIAAQNPGLMTSQQSSQYLTRGLVVCGADDPRTARALAALVSPNMPEFTQKAVPRRFRDSELVGPAVFLALFGAATAATGGAYSSALFLAAVGAATAAVASGGWPGVVTRWWAHRLATGTVVPERRRWLSLRWTTFGILRQLRDRDPEKPGRQLSPRVAHPFSARTLTFDPVQIAALAFPPPAASTNAASGDTHVAPAPVELRMAGSGPFVGTDCDDRPMYLPASQLPYSLFAHGDPGTGKTTMLLLNWKWEAELIARSEAHITPFLLDAKGEFARSGAELCSAAGVEPFFISPADPRSLRLCYDDPENPLESADVLAAAMDFAFGGDNIGYRALDTLRAIFRVALSVPEDLAVHLGMAGGEADVMEVANALVGSEGDDVADHTFATLAQACGLGLPEAGGDEAMARFRDALGAYNTHRQTALLHDGSLQASPFFYTSANKLRVLRDTGIWRPGRRRVTVPQLLATGRPVIVNFGRLADSPALTDADSHIVAAMFLYVFWHHVQRVCSGWLTQGRTVSLYCDEIALLCRREAEAAELIREMHDTGRDRGLRMYLAAQRLDQVDARLRSALRGFGTKAWFRAESLEVAREAAEDLAVREGEGAAYGLHDIRDQPRHWAALRTHDADGKALAPCSVHLALPTEPEPEPVDDEGAFL